MKDFYTPVEKLIATKCDHISGAFASGIYGYSYKVTGCLLSCMIGTKIAKATDSTALGVASALCGSIISNAIGNERMTHCYKLVWWNN